MIVLDTSVVIGALAAERKVLPAVTSAIEQGHRLMAPSLVLFEWLRGPRLAEEITLQKELFPAANCIAFGSEEASMAAYLYKSVGRARGREMDLCIAACAIVRGAELWTMNRADFADIPGLRLRVIRV